MRVVTLAAMLDMVKEFFDKEGWESVPSIRRGKMIVRFIGENGEFDCQATVEEEEGLFVFHSVIEPGEIEASIRKELKDLINKCNFGMYVGNFELDPVGDQLRFKTGIDVMDDRLTPALIRNVVYGNVIIMDKHLPVFRKIIEEDATADEAIGELE